MPCPTGKPCWLVPPYMNPGPPVLKVPPPDPLPYQDALTSSSKPAAYSILAMQALAAAVSTLPIPGAPPQAAGKRQFKTVPSGILRFVGFTIPPFHGMFQNNWLVNATNNCP